MTVAELKTLLAQILHRADLTAQMGNFINASNTRINTRFNVALVVPIDTDPLPANPMLYQYAALQAAYEYLNNGDNAVYYGQAFLDECDRAGMVVSGTPLDQFGSEPPTITQG